MRLALREVEPAARARLPGLKLSLCFTKWIYCLWLDRSCAIRLQDSMAVLLLDMTLAASAGKAVEILKS